MKKTISLVLAIIISLLMIPVGVYATDVGSVDAGYTPAEGAIAVSTVAEFEAMGEGKSYYLTKDIDFLGKTYDDYIIEFANFTLDGCGHSLLGIKIKYKNTVNAGIFFDTLAGTVIKNLVIGSESTPAVIDGESGSSGVLMVAAKKTITVENVKVYGNVSSTSTSGGFFGYVAVDKFVMTDCEFNGTVTATGGRDAGGIIGRIRKCNSVEMKNCVNNGTIVSNDTAKDRGTGGIIGVTECKLNLTDCVNRGNVSTDGNYAGGILGGVRAGIGEPINIVGCSNYGKIRGMETGKTDDGYRLDNLVDAGIGGIVGGTSNGFAYSAEETLTIDGCMNYGTVQTNGSSAAAIIGKGVATEDDAEVYRIIIKNTGNAGRVEYGNKEALVGIFVSVSNTNSEGAISISNSFNIGSTDSNNAYAALYNLNGDVQSGNAKVSDFYFLEGTYSSAANSQNVKISGALACSSEKFASGEIAYVLGVAFGQNLGTDSYPIPGGPAITISGTEYVNVSTLAKSSDGTANPYIQTTEAVEGKQTVRFIIVVDADAIKSATDAEMTIKFSKSGAEDVSYTLSNEKITVFKSVKAADDVYLAADGSVILGVVVENVVEADWDSVSILLSATSESGNSIAALRVSASYTK